MPKKPSPEDQCKSMHPKLGMQCQLRKDHSHSHQANGDDGIGHGWNDVGPKHLNVPGSLSADMGDQPDIARINKINEELSAEMSRQVAATVEGILQAVPGLDESAAKAIAEQQRRVQSLEEENKWLRDQLEGAACDAFHEIVSHDKETGWYCSDARGTAVYWGDVLVRMGLYEKDESRGFGRIQYYRPIVRNPA